jgi:hypothetical protein
MHKNSGAADYIKENLHQKKCGEFRRMLRPIDRENDCPQQKEWDGTENYRAFIKGAK